MCRWYAGWIKGGWHLAVRLVNWYFCHYAFGVEAMNQITELLIWSVAQQSVKKSEKDSIVE